MRSRSLKVLFGITGIVLAALIANTARQQTTISRLNRQVATLQQFMFEVQPKVENLQVEVATIKAAVPAQPFSLEDCGTITEQIFIAPSEVRGKSVVVLPLKDYKVSGYCLVYPEIWKVQLAGPEGMNLLFNQVDGTPKVFLQVARSNLTLAQADQATYSFELSGPTPFVPPGDVAIYRKIELIGGRETLVRVSRDNPITRYFLKHGNAIYMFQTDISGDDLSAVREAVSSIKFLQ